MIKTEDTILFGVAADAMIVYNPQTALTGGEDSDYHESRLPVTFNVLHPV